MNDLKETPMIKQYLSIKKEYPDTILFYRMGDFFEMFFEDAKVASPILEITLTSRNKNKEFSVPMCGIPARAADVYIQKLINKGFKVAVCDQVENPAFSKGLVKREVVRIVTPGMIIDNRYLDSKTNNFIISVALEHDMVGLSCIDISTGMFNLTQSKDISLIINEISSIDPKEIILQKTDKDDVALHSLNVLFSGKTVTYLEKDRYDYINCKNFLTEQFEIKSLRCFGCENKIAGICAAGALLSYIHETQKQKIDHLSKINTYDLKNYLVIDEVSTRNLELLNNLQNKTRAGTLLSVIDKTVTSMGARKLKTWIKYPLIDKDKIMSRLDAVSEAKEKFLQRKKIRTCLKSIQDMERLCSKISMGRCNGRDLTALKHSLMILPEIENCILDLDSLLFKFNSKSDQAELLELAKKIDASIREDAPLTITDGNIIKEGFVIELDELINISRTGKEMMLALEKKEREKTGIKSLKLKFNKVFGYFIEISKSQIKSIPPYYIRKQTLVNAERYITEELKEVEIKVTGAEEKRFAMELDIFDDIRKTVTKKSEKIFSVASDIAKLDVLLGFAEVAVQNDYVRPDINLKGVIYIRNGRHPVVEKTLTNERFVPNSILIDNKNNQVLIITGPNMSGKSTVLRQTALFVLMTQIGAFVPAEKVSVPVTDKIFTRVGALDNLSAGQSTFMVEMEETANIINNATNNSLIIIDEIGRGTSTFDGLSIAWAVAEHLHDFKKKGVKTLFATHYHELTALEQTKKRVKNFHIAVKENNGKVTFLRKLAKGGTNRSYGIYVAQLAGMPKTVLKKAAKILKNIEKQEHNLNGALVLNNKKKSISEITQLSMFPDPKDLLLKEIKSLDVFSMTPIEAISYLNEIKEKTVSVLQKKI